MYLELRDAVRSQRVQGDEGSKLFRGAGIPEGMGENGGS